MVQGLTTSKMTNFLIYKGNIMSSLIDKSNEKIDKYFQVEEKCC